MFELGIWSFFILPPLVVSCALLFNTPRHAMLPRNRQKGTRRRQQTVPEILLLGEFVFKVQFTTNSVGWKREPPLVVCLFLTGCGKQGINISSMKPRIYAARIAARVLLRRIWVRSEAKNPREVLGGALELAAQDLKLQVERVPA